MKKYQKSSTYKRLYVALSSDPHRDPSDTNAEVMELVRTGLLTYDEAVVALVDWAMRKNYWAFSAHANEWNQVLGLDARIALSKKWTSNGDNHETPISELHLSVAGGVNKAMGELWSMQPWMEQRIPLNAVMSGRVPKTYPAIRSRDDEGRAYLAVWQEEHPEFREPLCVLYEESKGFNWYERWVDASGSWAQTPSKEIDEEAARRLIDMVLKLTDNHPG